MATSRILMGGNTDNSVVLSVGDEYHLRSAKDNIVYAGSLPYSIA